MAVTADTLRRIRQLMNTVGGHADDTVRALSGYWLRARQQLDPHWRAALVDLLTHVDRTGTWPPPWQLARIQTIADVTTRTETALTTLAAQSQVTTTQAATAAVAATAAAEPALAASQAPADLATHITAQFASRILPTALDEIVRRSAEQTTALTGPLSAEAMESVRRALIAGIRAGENPNDTARRMVAQIGGVFTGGLTRATVIARTEVLDAYRTASHYCHRVNSSVLAGWVWHSELRRGRTCIACWSMHGRLFDLTEPGPLDHPQGRCSRVPRLRPWRELGINATEPADVIVDAEQRFASLPRAQQLHVAGRARLALLDAGLIRWDELAYRRGHRGWRDSYQPTPVRVLRRTAARRQ